MCCKLLIGWDVPRPLSECINTGPLYVKVTVKVFPLNLQTCLSVHALTKVIFQTNTRLRL